MVISFDSRYKFTGKERDEETAYDYFGARYYDSDLSQWLSVDPMSDKYPSLSPYNYCENNPVVLIDPNGNSTSPIYDTDGNYLGTDNQGFSGDILIFDDPSKFKQGMEHSEAEKIGKVFSSDLNLSMNVQNKIFNHIITGTEFPDGKILKSSEFYAYVKSMFDANARYMGNENGKYNIALDIGDYEWTVENVRSNAIHEIWGHGIKKYGDDTKTHYKCYFSEIDNKYWDKTTLRFKTSTLTKMWEYYYKEIGYKPLPKKYGIEYYKYVK